MTAMIPRWFLLLGLLALGGDDKPRRAALPHFAPKPSSRLADVGPRQRPNRPGRPKLLRPRPAKAHPAFRLKWKAKVGLTHFRTTLLAIGEQVIVPSNGATFKGKEEKEDGVYIIDGRSGKLVRLIREREGKPGDRDVNGIASDGHDLYFGTDEGELYKVSLNGAQRAWRVELDGDIEGAPALGDINGDGQLEVVAATESGTLYALAAKDGKELWRATTGSLPTYGARGFMAAPALGDLNGDGALDVVIGARDGTLRAYSGKTGKVLWSFSGDSGIHASATLRDLDGDGKLDAIAAWSYSHVRALDGRKGRVLWDRELQHPGGGIEGLFSSPVPFQTQQDWCVLIGTAWWRTQEAMVCVGPERELWRFSIPTGKISSSAIIADWVVGGEPEIAFGGEDGALYVLDAHGKELFRAPTRGPIECTPLTADVDGDGLLELLVASQDGYLYCYDTPSKGPVQAGKLHYDAANTGQAPARQSLKQWLEKGRRGGAPP